MATDEMADLVTDEMEGAPVGESAAVAAGMPTGEVAAVVARPRSDRGAATAELAVALPGLVLLLGAGSWLLALVGAQLRCSDAAAEAARALGRGESASVARQVAQQVAPHGAAVSFGFPAVRRLMVGPGSGGGNMVRVQVRAELRPPFSGVLPLPALTVASDAVALAPPPEDPGAVR